MVFGFSIEPPLDTVVSPQKADYRNYHRDYP